MSKLLTVRQQTSLFFSLIILILALAYCAVRTVECTEKTIYYQHDDKCRQSAYEGKLSETTWQWLTKDAASFFTFVLALLTAILAGVSIVQIFYLRRSDETARRSAEAATTAASAALIQASVSERMLISLERPLIIPTDISISFNRTNLPDPHGTNTLGTVHAHVIFQNHGRTLGIIREIKMSLPLERWPDKCFPTSDNLNDLELFVHPKDEAAPTFTVTQRVRFDEMEQLIGPAVPFLHIRIIYYDAFETMFVRKFTARILSSGKIEVLKGPLYSGEERRETAYDKARA